MATIRPCPCWRRGRPSPADYGPTCVTTGHSPGRRLRPRCSSTRVIEPASIRTSIWLDMTASCRLMPMPDSMSSMRRRANRDRSPRRPVGHMGGGSSSSWPRLHAHRLPSRRCGGSMPSSTSSAASTACRQSNASPCARSASCRWWRLWKPGCARRGAKCPDMPMSPKPWITCSSDGTPSVASSAMAGSASATTPPSGHCEVSRSDESPGCSPDQTRVRLAAHQPMSL